MQLTRAMRYELLSEFLGVDTGQYVDNDVSIFVESLKARCSLPLAPRFEVR
jgi:hypothetical protein